MLHTSSSFYILYVSCSGDTVSQMILSLKMCDCDYRKDTTTLKTEFKKVCDHWTEIELEMVKMLSWASILGTLY